MLELLSCGSCKDLKRETTRQTQVSVWTSDASARRGSAAKCEAGAQLPFWDFNSSVSMITGQISEKGEQALTAHYSQAISKTALGADAGMRPQNPARLLESWDYQPQVTLFLFLHHNASPSLSPTSDKINPCQGCRNRFGTAHLFSVEQQRHWCCSQGLAPGTGAESTTGCPLLMVLKMVLNPLFTRFQAPCV